MTIDRANHEAPGEGSDPARQPSHSGGLGVDMLLGIFGAVAGAVLGHLLVFAIATQGFYAIILPGALVGLGCGALSGRRSVALGIICGFLGLAAGIYTQWRLAPFIKDQSLSFYLGHLADVNRMSQIMILIGAAFAFWFGMGRKGGAWIRKRETGTPRGA